MKESYLRYFNDETQSYVRIPLKAKYMDRIMAHIESLQGEIKLDGKKRFTYIDPVTGEPAKAVYNRVSPKKAAKSIFVKILSMTDESDVKVNLTVMNIDTEKQYYYECSAVKNEKTIRVSDEKVITQRYTINISSVSAEFIATLNKT